MLLVSAHYLVSSGIRLKSGKWESSEWGSFNFGNRSEEQGRWLRRDPVGIFLIDPICHVQAADYRATRLRSWYSWWQFFLLLLSLRNVSFFFPLPSISLCDFNSRWKPRVIISLIHCSLLRRSRENVLFSYNRRAPFIWQISIDKGRHVVDAQTPKCVFHSKPTKTICTTLDTSWHMNISRSYAIVTPRELCITIGTVLVIITVFIIWKRVRNKQ